jgi:chromosome segregation ATPase
MITIQDLKEKDQAYQQERENLSNRLKINEKSLKDAENEIGELTDKILHLTQENNELNAIIEDLRNSVVDKGNQIE